MENASIANGASGGIENCDGHEGLPSLGHKRSSSGSFLSKLSFLRSSPETSQDHANGPPSPERLHGEESKSPKKTGKSLAVAVQQHKTRRRKGSLRKAALIGRGAQREKKEQISPLNIRDETSYGADGATSPTDSSQSHNLHDSLLQKTSPYPANPYTTQNSSTNSSPSLPRLVALHPTTHTGEPLPAPQPIMANTTSLTLTYTSTTDEEDILTLPSLRPSPSPSPDGLLSSGSDSYFTSRPSSLTRRRSLHAHHKPTSPLSISAHGLGTAPLPTGTDAEWDYSETEYWGWVVLIVTWVVFVIGMGSCLGVWSWAWDVGETPYAPPELEDDPTLPIVGYYPALIILTGVMAWVWVVVAWVGMKYFRHAKISGD